MSTTQAPAAPSIQTPGCPPAAQGARGAELRAVGVIGLGRMVSPDLSRRLALAEAERLVVPMPVAGIVHDRPLAMAAREWQELDWPALGLLAASEAGLDTSSTSARQP